MSSAAAKSRPEKPGKLGKHIEPRIPPASMSFTRSAMSQQPGRISSKAVGSMPYSSLGRPATALSPTLGISAPLNIHTSEPSSLRTTFGAGVPVLRGDVGVEHRRRLDEVVVDAHHDHVVRSHGPSSGSGD